MLGCHLISVCVLVQDELEEMMAAAVDVLSGEIHYEFYINSLMVILNSVMVLEPHSQIYAKNREINFPNWFFRSTFDSIYYPIGSAKSEYVKYCHNNNEQQCRFTMSFLLFGLTYISIYECKSVAQLWFGLLLLFFFSFLVFGHI